jgi:hypothetical protein
MTFLRSSMLNDTRRDRLLVDNLLHLITYRLDDGILSGSVKAFVTEVLEACVCGEGVGFFPTSAS